MESSDSMKNITIEQIKQIELEILEDVASFCDKYNLRYYLCGGTLIGAIRHKGFIPWDDDIDIIMPRPDYIKFVRLYNSHRKDYKVHSNFTDKYWYSTFAEVEDTRTKKIYKGFNLEGDYGITIDIFPIDGSPDNRIKRKIFWTINNFLTRIATLSKLNFSISYHFVDQDKRFSTIRTLVRTGIKFLGIPVARFICKFWDLNRIVTQRAMKYDVDKSEYIGVSTFPHYGYKECIRRGPFLKQKLRIFEGKYFSTPDYYDEYLKNLYGDYMKMPPKEKQVPHHNFVAYWRK